MYSESSSISLVNERHIIITLIGTKFKEVIHKFEIEVKMFNYVSIDCQLSGGHQDYHDNIQQRLFTGNSAWTGGQSFEERNFSCFIRTAKMHNVYNSFLDIFISETKRTKI